MGDCFLTNLGSAVQGLEIADILKPVGTVGGNKGVSSATLDIKSIYPEFYSRLTVDNFVLTFGTGSAAMNRSSGNSGSDNHTLNSTPAKSYNASTGILTITGLMYSTGLNSYMGTLYVYTKVDVCAIVPDSW